MKFTDVSGKTDFVRHAYDRLAPEYDRRWRPYIDTTLKAVLETVQFEGHETVLDVPCGTGELEQRMLSEWPDLQITGADLSPGMLRQAGEKDLEKRVKWIKTDVVSLPLPDAEFDYVICANSFHYFRRPKESLVELRRVLRPGGTFILVDWCDDYLTCKLCSLWLRWTNAAFYRMHSLRGCRSLLEHEGFQIVDANRFRINWLWGLMRFVCRRAADEK
jgi:ubiquinone/menaquinone biosynthesis C-methylase UbiE